MSRYVKIATVAPRPPRVPSDIKPQAVVDFMMEFWRGKLGQVLPDKPDLIVVPECCDRPASEGFSLEKRLAYYRQRKDQIQDFFAQTARENHSYIVYAVVREMADGSWRNSIVLLDRQGDIAGIYNKNHPVMEEEHDKAGILCGKDAPIIECDFGTVAGIICFDLGFAPLLEKYTRAKPDLLIFSSMYHGDAVVQSWWAYSCRAHFVSAVAGLPSEIRNPYGQVLATTTTYRDYAVGTVNLDCCMTHYDYNWEKLDALKRKYGAQATILDPGYFGSVLISSESDEITATAMVKEFEIELLDDYLARELARQEDPANIEK